MVRLPRSAPGATLVLLCSLGWTTLGAQHRYADPAGRFELRVPAGWSASPLSDGAASLRKANATVVIMLSGGPPADALERLLLQHRLWKEFREIRRGEDSLGGRAGRYVLASGRDPRGAAQTVRIIAAEADSGTLLLVARAPTGEFDALAPAVEGIGRGIRLSGAEPPPVAAADPPAPATTPPPSPVAEPTQPPAPATRDRAFLGVSTRTVDSVEVKRHGLDQVRGAIVGQLYPGGPAEQAGLEVLDVVIGADGSPINAPEDLMVAVAKHRAGETITLQVVRQGQIGTVRVKLGRPPEP